ncbi:MULTISPECIES: hypothetical protein [Flavobacterium]|uniref:Uncharacterized protein n=1 Tax=Flavobacterium cutihirudinis TaxID=1265740 RepID=A0A3D9G1B8_9FLAO|nr:MULTISPECIES: hypothetical protein [Flavobacterium]MBZ4040944.1 hypothetical protein [Flavobacterium hibisci]RED27008.1 hypothetical protein BD847_0939 [Flavobacterium cutihirudinis]
MLNKFTTSVNIIRDEEKEINYIPTHNAIRLASQIVSDFKKGIRSFNIIGSYGTGKSSFLLAFQESLSNRKKYFNVAFLPNQEYGKINIIGEYRSLIDVFIDLFDLESKNTTAETIFSEVFNRYYALGQNPLLIVTIDEFGKFLEYASKNNPEKELFFLQQFSEFVNDTSHNIVLLTSVHQNFDAYAFSLDYTQKQEWTKVKGRFKEITFNEPIEQLLFLAAEHLNKLPSSDRENTQIKEANKLLYDSKAFNFNEDYISEIAEKLYPLDAISAYVITQSLQKYGQNERSLFTFLESTDFAGLFQFKQLKKGFYSLPEIYDYLTFNFYSFLNSKYNPDFNSWKSIKNALEVVETSFETNLSDYSKLIKSIGVLNINTGAGAVLDSGFWEKYSEKVLSVNNSKELLKNLVDKKIIVYRNYLKRFILHEGTDLDIELALLQAENKVDNITDVVTMLNKYYNLHPVLAKKVMFEVGTPRLFEYKISHFPIDEIPQNEIDGFINLVFNDKDILDEVKIKSAESQEAILYCYYKNAKQIKELLFEIEKTRKVIAENENDKVATRELNNIVQHQINLLNHKILNNFYGTNSEVVWFYKGSQLEIKSKKDLNSKLSEISDAVYCNSPIFKNELVNKHKISTSIHVAKKNYLKALVTNWNKSQLGFPEDKFPAEKTIYLSLLENNDIYLYSDKISDIIKPNERNRFNFLWDESLNFLESAKIGRRKVSEFADVLSKRPYKLKQGLIDLWIPTFLFIKRDDFALFSNNGYIANLSDEVLELLIKKPEDFEIKTFAIEGVKLDIFNRYRIFLDQTTKEKISNDSFIETIKPFLTFYRDLPDYTKNTNRLSKEALGIRSAIFLAKDPEHTFFESFPNALNFKIQQIQSSAEKLQSFSIKLQDSIKEIRNCYDELINRVEDFIKSDIVGEDFDFEDYKNSLQTRYKKLRRHLLLPSQKIFVQRLDSQIDDKKAWLNSLVQSLIGKTLDKTTDEDELLIYDKFKSMIMELDSLTSLSKSDFNEEKEDVYDLQINTFFKGISKKIIRLPKEKKEEVFKIQKELENVLSRDSSLNIAALTNLLKEMLKNE